MKNATSHAFVIPLAQKTAWTKYVSTAYKYDFYHTWDYQTLTKNGEAILFVYEDHDDFIAFPMLKKAIPDSDYFDLNSVYGYTGPISNLRFSDVKEYFILQFQQSLLKFLKEENCVSVFAKFHPFFNQTIALEKLGGIFDNGKTVAIDLKQPLEHQRKKYRASTLDAIKKARKLGFITREAQGEEDIIQFTKLYLQNMERIGANGFYMFDETYFTSLLNSTQCNAKLILVIFESEMISASLITLTKGILQAHLIATNSNYLKYSPSKFLVDEISLIGRKHGMEYYHLGGGLGFKENSLLDWKLGFSDLILPHKSWRFIVDQNAYKKLVEQTGNDVNSTIDFFPLYRMTPQVI
jgi:hypothetical protein